MYRFSQTLKYSLSGLFVAGLLTVGGPSAFAAPADVAPEVHQQFAEKLRERNTLTRKLHRLDREAADLVMRGESAIHINAKQQSLQDQLNVVELRLAIMSNRYDFEVPPSPVADPPRISREPVSPSSKRHRVARDLAPDGHARAQAVIQRELEAMLARLAFTGFPGADQREDRS